MRLISWNVNGLRSCLGKGLLDFIKNDRADVYCLQETRISAEGEEIDWPAGYRVYWNHAEKKGYAGTLLLTRQKPVQVWTGIGLAEADREGRVLTAEFDDFYLVNAYVPNSQRELSRLSFRQHQWDPALLAYLRELERAKPVVIGGDFNVAHQEIDLANPSSNRRNAGFTDEERAGFSRYLEHGFIDTFREFEKAGGHYTWWSFRFHARARNIGWRLDYFLISSCLRPRLQKAFILPGVTGSDHCPAGMELEG